MQHALHNALLVEILDSLAEIVPLNIADKDQQSILFYFHVGFFTLNRFGDLSSLNMDVLHQVIDSGVQLVVSLALRRSVVRIVCGGCDAG